LIPKDADLLVTIDESIKLAELAHAGRRLQGFAQAINLGADIFLANDGGCYVGRICHYRKCFPRVACLAQNCGGREHLNDDLQVVTLSKEFALIVSDQAEHFTNRRLIVELAEKQRLPAIYPYRQYVELGGLMAYAIDLVRQYRRAADYIDQILKGANPGEIPVYQEDKFELVINVKAANAIGVTIPPALLLRADEVIE
jgi:ABC transporter substrate binding protein